MTVYLGDKAVGVNTIVEKEVAKTKFGASVDTWIGDVDENGVLQKPATQTALNFAGVKEIAYEALHNAFYTDTSITSVDFSSLESVGVHGLYNAFYGCTGITSVDLSSLQSVDLRGLSYAFKDTGITTVDLGSLQSVGSFGLDSVFDGCLGITSVDLSSLQSVDSNGLVYAFYRCASLTTISFPSLTSVQTNSFNRYTFSGCTALTEIHFRADMQETIEAMSGYSDKFGAPTTCTIYFDL